MSELSLDGKVAFIIGAGRPPGPILARAFLAHGAMVAANDLSPNLLDPMIQTARQLDPDASERLRTYVADATRGMPLRAMLDEVLEAWGRIDILVNNPRIRPEANLLEMDEYDWQRVIEMNLNGPFLVTKLVARLMREQGQGVILNIVDSNPRIIEDPLYSAYAASQAGLLAFSQSAARELIAYNIRVCTLCPEGETFEGKTPGKSKTPDPLARLAVFLCSEEAAHLNGQVFRVSRPRAIQEE